jgi:mannan endo-1,4-beta-mannosidase
MLTWANYGGDTTPYTPVDGEMLPDFQAFHQDPYTYFADDLEGVHDAETVPVASEAAHLASPADGARVATGPMALRASVIGYDADRVTVSVDGGPTIELTAPAAGEMWWTGEWDVPEADLDNSTRGLTLHLYSGEAEVGTVASSVVLGAEPVLPPGVVDDFEGYGDQAALSNTWVPQNANTIDLLRSADGDTVGGGEKALRMAYSFAAQSYTGVGRQISGDWSAFEDFEVWIDPDASSNKLVLQLVADGVAFEAYPSLAADEPHLATIPFADWRPAPWDTGNADRRLDTETLSQVTQFSVFVNAVEGGAVEGGVAVDEMRAVPGTPPPPAYPDVHCNHPDYEAIQWLHDEVIDLSGPGGRFQPRRAVTHAELEQVIEAYRSGGVPEFEYATGATHRDEAALVLWHLAGSPDPAGSPDFVDVDPSDPAADAIAWAVEAGVIDPVRTERFGTERPVKRANLARWLHRLDELMR